VQASKLAPALPERRSLLDKGRLRRIRNVQANDFYGRLVMRPLSILLMIACADWRWLTPNLVTTAANVAKLAGVLALVHDHEEHAVLAVVLLQLGCLLDHLDGTLARYRGTSSGFGALYDKVSDAVTWLVISGAVGWAAYKDTHDIALPMLALAAAYALLLLGYMKWIVMAASKTSPATPAVDPPSRTPGEWARWFAGSLARVVMFEEIDLYFWIGIGVLTGHLELLVYVLAISQGLQLVVMLIKRGLQMRAIDENGASR
jgi:phosphatidylglycerophosphate synthase